MYVVRNLKYSLILENARHAYSIHVVDGKEGVHYPKDNWLQRPEEHPFQEITAQWSDCHGNLT